MLPLLMSTSLVPNVELYCTFRFMAFLSLRCYGLTALWPGVFLSHYWTHPQQMLYIQHCPHTEKASSCYQQETIINRTWQCRISWFYYFTIKVWFCRYNNNVEQVHLYKLEYREKVHFCLYILYCMNSDQLKLEMKYIYILRYWMCDFYEQ